MNDETIFDPKEVKQSPANNGLMEDSVMENDTMQDVVTEERKKKKGFRFAGAAGLGGATGAALGVLIPKLVFPDSVEEGSGTNEEPSGEGEGSGLNEVEAPNLSGHLTGHNMDVAHGVNDSMSFNQAFAAARSEVGPGGLFEWRGNTYGTYYRNEWDAMSAEDKEQYWADVSHTTSHFESDQTPDQPLEDPNQLADNKVSDENNVNQGGEGDSNDEINDPQPPTPPDETGSIADNGGNNGENSIDNPETPEVPVDGVAGNGDEIPSFDEPETPEVPVEGLVGNEDEIPTIEDPETLVLSENDVIVEFDLDGDGIADTGFVDANGNEIADVVLDTTGDGSYDTLVIDPEVDDSGNLVVAEENIVDIGGVEITNVDDNLIIDNDETGDGLVDDDIIAENPDVDDFASLTPDPDITIDNDMDMNDFA